MKPSQVHRQLRRIARAYQSAYPFDAMGTGFELLKNSEQLDKELHNPDPDHSYIQHLAEEVIRSALFMLAKVRGTLDLTVTGHAALLTLRFPANRGDNLEHATQAVLRHRIDRSAGACAYWIAHLVGLCLAVIRECDRENYGFRFPDGQRVEVAS
jgi:hypothetical protein